MPDFEYEDGPKVKLKDYAVPNQNKYRDKDANDVADYMSETRTQAETADGKAETAQTDIDNHKGNLANPHVVTKAQVSLGNVDNTSDADKPVSDDTQAALDLKANEADTGDKANLDTDDKSTLVAGINEVNANTDNAQSDINQTNALLLKGSDAYTHAERGVADGFEVERLVQLDQVIEDNLRTPFKSTFGFGRGIGKIGTAIPDISNADFGYTNSATQDYIDKFGNTQTAAINEPAFDWSLGYPALLLNDNSDNATTGDNSSRIDSQNFVFTHKGILDINGGSNKDVILSDGNQSNVILRNNIDGVSLSVFIQKGGSDIVNSIVPMPNPSGIVREHKLLSNSNGTILKSNGVIMYVDSVQNPYSANELGILGHSTGPNKYKGKSVSLSVDVRESFDLTATTLEELDATLTNYNIR